MTTTQKVLGGIGAAVLATGVAIVVNQPATTSTPLASITFTQLPYAHSGMTWQTGQQGKPRYSGRYIVSTHQWGAYVVNADTGAFKMISPVGKISSSFQPPQYTIMGDCWNSATGIAVTPNTPKWVVIYGAPQSCPKRCGNVECSPRQFPDEIQVMRLDPPGFRFVGAISAPKVPSVNSELVIDGDTLYALQTGSTEKWTKADLNTLTVLAEDLLSAPPQVLQPNIDGYKYSIAGVYPTPIPSPWPGFQTFLLTRVGAGGTPTNTPSIIPPLTPTPSTVGNPYATYIEAIARAGITNGCGGGNFCPTREMTREEVAVWLAKALKLGLLPCEGMFHDVPCPTAAATAGGPL
jgi:hypothetical protein